MRLRDRRAGEPAAPVVVMAMGAREIQLPLALMEQPAAAIAETSNEIGNALGIALLGSVAALVFRVLGPEVAPTLDETLELAGTAGVVTQAKSAFLTGLHAAMAIGAVLCAGMGVLTLRWIPRNRRTAAAD